MQNRNIHNGQFIQTRVNKTNRTLIGLTFIGIVIVWALVIRYNDKSTKIQVPADASLIAQIARTTEPNSVLTDEEIAQVKLQQELVLKEAESLKVRDTLLADKASALAEFDKKIADVEKTLSDIRGSKLSFQLSPRQSVSQRLSTKPNAVVTVSVVGEEDLAKLVTSSSFQKRGEPTQLKQ